MSGPEEPQTQQYSWDEENYFRCAVCHRETDDNEDINA